MRDVCVNVPRGRAFARLRSRGFEGAPRPSARTRASRVRRCRLRDCRARPWRRVTRWDSRRVGPTSVRGGSQRDVANCDADRIQSGGSDGYEEVDELVDPPSATSVVIISQI